MEIIKSCFTAPTPPALILTSEDVLQQVARMDPATKNEKLFDPTLLKMVPRWLPREKTIRDYTVYGLATTLFGSFLSITSVTTGICLLRKGLNFHVARECLGQSGWFLKYNELTLVSLMGIATLGLLDIGITLTGQYLLRDKNLEKRYSLLEQQYKAAVVQLDEQYRQAQLDGDTATTEKSRQIAAGILLNKEIFEQRLLTAFKLSPIQAKALTTDLTWVAHKILDPQPSMRS